MLKLKSKCEQFYDSFQSESGNQMAGVLKQNAKNIQNRTVYLAVKYTQRYAENVMVFHWNCFKE